MAPRRPETIDATIGITGTGGIVASGPVTLPAPVVLAFLGSAAEAGRDTAEDDPVRAVPGRMRPGRQVPQQAAGVPMAAGPAAAVAAAWDPPSQSRLARWVAEQCPQCGAGKLAASPRGTVRECARGGVSSRRAA